MNKPREHKLRDAAFGMMLALGIILGGAISLWLEHLVAIVIGTGLFFFFATGYLKVLLGPEGKDET